MIVYQLLNGILSQIRVDGTGTVTKQCCKMVNLTRFTTLKDHSHCSSLFRLDQMLLHCRYSKQRRDSYMIFIHATVRQNQDIRTITVCTICLYKQTVNGFLKACVFIISKWYYSDLKAFFFHMFDL